MDVHMLPGLEMLNLLSLFVEDFLNDSSAFGPHPCIFCGFAPIEFPMCTLVSASADPMSLQHVTQNPSTIL